MLPLSASVRLSLTSCVPETFKLVSFYGTGSCRRVRLTATQEHGWTELRDILQVHLPYQEPTAGTLYLAHPTDAVPDHGDLPLYKSHSYCRRSGAAMSLWTVDPSSASTSATWPPSSSLHTRLYPSNLSPLRNGSTKDSSLPPALL